MPELPEVETIKRGLVKFLVHKRIADVEILCDKSFQGPRELLLNQTITNIRRRGKALLIDLENGITLLIHLRMTGQLIYRNAGIEDGADLMEVAHSQKISDTNSFAGGHPTDSFFTALPNQQTRVIISLVDPTYREKSSINPDFHDKSQSNHDHLYFNDQRKFGFIKVIPTDEVNDDSFIKSLAPEPWDMSAADFYQRLQHHPGAPIKAVILDQKVIAGLGNIYADEALFMSKIHPEQLAGSLSQKEATLLLQSARTVMEHSIDSGGSTMATYVRADGTRGNYLELFAQVFRREGQPCPVCGTEIIKIRVAGRGTHICPTCQMLHKKAPHCHRTQHSPVLTRRQVLCKTALHPHRPHHSQPNPSGVSS